VAGPPEGASSKVVYLIPTLQNPTGLLVPEGRRQELAEVAEEYDVLVIEDHTLRLLVAEPPPPLTALIPNRSFFIAATSKTIVGGLRVAFVASPKAFVEAVNAAISATVFMVSPPSREVAVLWIGDGTASRTVRRKRNGIAERQHLARTILNDKTFLSHPHSYYLWLDLGEGWSSAEFEAEARRRGVGSTPSRPFAASTSDAPSAVRVCLSAAENAAQLEVSLRTLAHLVSHPESRTPRLV
jgi:DNA-binding transcriptional MocR family regulator